MYTECTNCFTVFAVTVGDLRAARGRVRCGRCRFTFNAIENLGEGLPPAAARPRGSSEDRTATSSTPSAPRHVPVLAESQEKVGKATLEEEEVPSILREDMQRMGLQRQAERRRLLLGLAAAALLAVLALQHAWFEPDRLARSYPQIRSTLETFCAYTGCTLPDRRAPELVQMVSRDVRAHPKYEGALQLLATIVNVAPYHQPFPRMRFTVFNVNGQTIASRTFEPDDYLQRSGVSTRDMRPHRPIQLALELMAPEEAAVSFEFRFL